MGVSNTDKAELCSSQLKDVSQTCYNMWNNIRALRDGPMTLEIFKKAFLDIFFPMEQKEVKGRGVHQPSSRRYDVK